MENDNKLLYEDDKFLVYKAMFRSGKKKDIFIGYKFHINKYLHKDGYFYTSTHSEEGYTGWFKSLKKVKKAIQKHKELNK